MEENTEEKAEQTAEELLAGKEPLEIAEELIERNELDKAQEILNTVENGGRKYYVQSRLYKARKWYGEQRKQLKKAVKAEQDNEDYKKELKELEESAEMKQYKSGLRALRKNQMGQTTGGVCAELGAECCCMCICEGICEGLGNGC